MRNFLLFFVFVVFSAFTAAGQQPVIRVGSTANAIDNTVAQGESLAGRISRIFNGNKKPAKTSPQQQPSQQQAGDVHQDCGCTFEVTPTSLPSLTKKQNSSKRHSSWSTHYHTNLDANGCVRVHTVEAPAVRPRRV